MYARVRNVCKIHTSSNYLHDGEAISSALRGFAVTNLYVLMSTVPPPASIIITFALSYPGHVSNEHRDAMCVFTNCYGVGCKSTVNTVQKTSFTFADKRDPYMSPWSIRNQPSVNGGLSHLALLQSLPPIRMGENEIDAIAEGSPKT